MAGPSVGRRAVGVGGKLKDEVAGFVRKKSRTLIWKSGGGGGSKSWAGTGVCGQGAAAIRIASGVAQPAKLASKAAVMR